jgi:hypothetical protein
LLRISCSAVHRGSTTAVVQEHCSSFKFAAVHAQASAVLAAGHFQGQRQQHLLAQNIFEQNPVALIITDLGFRVGDRKFVAAGVSAERTVEQFKLARYFLRNRIEAARALQFEPCRQLPAQSDVLNNLVLAVMLFDQFGASAGLQRRALPGFAAQVDDTGLKYLLEIQRMAFQFMDVQEHCETSASTSPTQSG